MKRKFYVLNEVKGFFLENEEELCKEYCKTNGYTYHVEYWNIGY